MSGGALPRRGECSGGATEGLPLTETASSLRMLSSTSDEAAEGAEASSAAAVPAIRLLELPALLPGHELRTDDGDTSFCEIGTWPSAEPRRSATRRSGRW